jgi:hypothetical protein
MWLNPAYLAFVVVAGIPYGEAPRHFKLYLSTVRQQPNGSWLTPWSDFNRFSPENRHKK